MTDTIAVTIATPAEGPSLGVAPRHVDVDVVLVERGGSMPKPAARERTWTRRRDRLLHHIAEIAGHRHLPLPGIMTLRW